MKYVIALVVVLAGCSQVGPEENTENLPKDWQTFITHGPNYHYVFPVVMDDGTRCVAMAGGKGGQSITCDWRK